MPIAIMLSIVLAGVCASAGLLALKNAPGAHYIPLACIPLGFAVQQGLEGVIRLQLAGGALGSSLEGLSIAFLLMGEALWPVLIPLAVWLIEPDEVRKLLLTCAAVVGVCLSLGFAFVISISDYAAVIENAAVRYKGWIEFSPNFSYYPLSRTEAWRVSGLGWTVVPYSAVTLGSAVLSSHKYVRWFGYLCAAGLLISSALYRNVLISVWCIFAAICSLVILLQIRAARSDL